MTRPHLPLTTHYSLLTTHYSLLTTHAVLPMREYSIAAIPGDGIGVEVIAAGLKVLEVLAGREKGFRLKVEHFPWSSAYYQKHGQYIPDGGLEKLRTFDAIFF